MKNTQVIILVFLAAVILAGCGKTSADIVQPPVQIPAKDSAQTAVQEVKPLPTQPNLQDNQLPNQTVWPDGQTQQDDQGQVEVAVTPRNLNQHEGTLDFDVAMNTHSVDLSMNLAALAILSTDTGLIFNALSWSAPSGGHHISGVLQFPAVINNVHILDDASRLILTIQNVDAPERKFSWSLSE